MLNVSHASVRQILRLALPRTVGAAAYHFNLIVITAIASTLAVGSIAVFNFADNLQYVPVSLIGISFAVASFPALSSAFAQGKREEFARHFSSAFSKIVFFVVPVALLLFILRAQVVRLIFGTGEFGWLATQLTAASLGVFTLGIVPLSLIPLMVRSFFSMQDTRTPVLISISSVVLNIVLAFFFVQVFASQNIFSNTIVAVLDLTKVGDHRIIALPLALSLAAIFQFSLLAFFLSRKMQVVYLSNIVLSVRNAVLAGIPALFVAFVVLRVMVLFVPLSMFWGVFVQAGAAGLAGVGAYLFVSYLLHSRELLELTHRIMRKHER